MGARWAWWPAQVNESPDLRPRTPAKAAACARMLDGLVELVLAQHAQTLAGDTASAEEEGPSIYGFCGAKGVRAPIRGTVPRRVQMGPNELFCVRTLEPCSTMLWPENVTLSQQRCLFLTRIYTAV